MKKRKLTKKERELRELREKLFAEYLVFLNRIVDEIYEEAVGHGWSWLGLARRAGLSYGTVNNLGSRTTRVPQLLTIWKLCTAVDMDSLRIKQLKRKEAQYTNKIQELARS